MDELWVTVKRLARIANGWLKQFDGAQSRRTIREHRAAEAELRDPYYVAATREVDEWLGVSS